MFEALDDDVAEGMRCIDSIAAVSQKAAKLSIFR